MYLMILLLLDIIYLYSALCMMFCDLKGCNCDDVDDGETCSECLHKTKGNIGR